MPRRAWAGGRFVGLLLLCLSWSNPADSVAQSPATTPSPAAKAKLYKAEAGPYQVETSTEDWQDRARNRQVPVRFYAPKNLQGPLPVVLFSHGLGGSRDGYRYLGEHWASHGYLCVILQHPGSDDSVWRGQAEPLAALRKAAGTLQNSLDRPRDVQFAVDHLTELNQGSGVWAGRCDLKHLGMAGHSFGAFTTLAAAGQTFVGPLGVGLQLEEKRIVAAIPMSAPVTGSRDNDRLDQAFGSIRVPCLHLTGTLDDSPLNETKAAERRLPFDHAPDHDQYLAILQGGDHMIFSGVRRVRSADSKRDADHLQIIRATTTAFWDAYLREDPAALHWLTGGDCAACLGTRSTWEVRPPASR